MTVRTTERPRVNETAAAEMKALGGAPPGRLRAGDSAGPPTLPVEGGAALSGVTVSTGVGVRLEGVIEGLCEASGALAPVQPQAEHDHGHAGDLLGLRRGLSRVRQALQRGTAAQPRVRQDARVQHLQVKRRPELRVSLEVTDVAAVANLLRVH